MDGYLGGENCYSKLTLSTELSGIQMDATINREAMKDNTVFLKVIHNICHTSEGFFLIMVCKDSSTGWLHCNKFTGKILKIKLFSCKHRLFYKDSYHGQRPKYPFGFFNDLI